MTTRYAIYYTPAQDTALWQVASSWLGRDSLADRPRNRPIGLALTPQEIDAATAGPSRYGFHATLCAPFEPSTDTTPSQLVDALAAFVRQRTAFRVRLKIGRMDDFLALVPVEHDQRLNDLAAACVRGFDRFRAPLSRADLARRLTPDLNERELALLMRWGYAHVLEEFRFHMSLTGGLPDAALARLHPELEALLAPVLADPVTIDGLSLLMQAGRERPFHGIGHFRFAAAPALAIAHG
jgi:putative phosphonate metabolism protein